MKFLLLSSLTILFAAGCASRAKQDTAGLEKYPQCYHKNVKIAKKCIEKNDAGENVTALQLENTAYPGQYK
jgi:hypothetical protein